MKQFAVAALLLIAQSWFGCGSNNSNSSNINGNWTASLVSGGNAPVFAFTTAMTENSDNSVSVTNFSFTTTSPCFQSNQTETGSFTLAGNFNGNVTGKFGMTVQSGTPSGNLLTLTGNVNGNTITGNWTLTGTSTCSGSGTFTMTRM